MSGNAEQKAHKRQITTQLSYWGNSLAVRIPKAVVKNLNLINGQEVNLTYEEGDNLFSVEKISDRKKKKLKFDIRELMAQAVSENHPEEIEWGAPQGREVW